MTAVRTFVSRLWGSLTKRQHEGPLGEEIETHLALLADEFQAQGMSLTEARLAARREFGGVEAIKDSTRDERGYPALASWVQDVRFALRQLRRQPGFAAAAIATLALGIGATAGIFSVVDVVLLRPLPYLDADRLVVLHEHLPDRGRIPVSPADAEVWARSTSSFEYIGLMAPSEVTITGVGAPQKLAANSVTSAALAILRPQLELGRLFLESEGVPGRDHVAILSYELWRQRFNGDRSIIGRVVQLDGEPYEVVGVLAVNARPIEAGRLYDIPLRPTGPPQVWAPLAFSAEDRRTIGNNSFGAIAKLRAGVTITQAPADLAAVQADLVRQIPGKGDVQTVIVPLHDQLAARSRAGLRLLAVAVVSVLLIGCANIVNLLLARALTRRREMAVRQALGAGRWRLVRQVLVEQFTLAAIGGATSLLVAYGAMRFLVLRAPADLPRLEEVAFSARIVWFTVGASTVCALLIACLPAMRLGGQTLIGAMTTRSATGTRSTGRIRAALVSAQIGVCVACLTVGALLLQSFVRLLNVDRGFDASSLLTVRVDLAAPRYQQPRIRAEFMDEAAAATRQLPGVTTVAIADRLPLTGTGANSALSTEGTTLPVPLRPLADTRSVTPDYFTALGLPLKQGRLFTAADRERLVAVLSANLAAQGWPADSPLGKRFRFGSNPQAPLYEVIGVVGDARNRTLDAPPTETAYVQFPARAASGAILIVKTAAAAPPLAGQIRALIQARDPELPVPALQTLDDVATESLSLRRFQLYLVVFFAIAAGLLTVVGVYGLMSYSVTQRTTEFGVRLALGAPPDRLVRLILKDAVMLSLGGVAIGVPVLAAAGSILQSLLFEVKPFDPITTVAVVCLVMAAALLAAYAPGRRVSRIDPTLALRAE